MFFIRVHCKSFFIPSVIKRAGNRVFPKSSVPDINCKTDNEPPFFYFFTDAYQKMITYRIEILLKHAL
ncbi:MAG: hypothetical protein BWK80_37710 [Desulfobacteraceae bacterium IS3]|nr:MAG: hypothetical protein BWK80_37710 [Desulfobacteraceae bacterium IS3]